jgi:hypothetical protein
MWCRGDRADIVDSEVCDRVFEDDYVCRGSNEKSASAKRIARFNLSNRVGEYQPPLSSPSLV